jgi:hypothetical protein
MNDTRQLLARFGKSNVYGYLNGIFYESGLAIDADGSPRCYHPISDKGLDALICAGHPGRWWGIATNTDNIDGKEGRGRPFIQDENDPCPGFYVSTTSHVDGSKKLSDPNRYVDSETVPFIVLPPHLGIAEGALAMVFNPETGDSSAAIYADGGPTGQIGEGSIALAKNLSVNPNPRGGGKDWGIVTLVFTNTHRDCPIELEDVVNTADKNFIMWGGFTRLHAMLPEANWK